MIDIEKIRIVSSGAMNPAVNISRYLIHIYVKLYFQFSTYLPVTLYLLTTIFVYLLFLSLASLLKNTY